MKNPSLVIWFSSWDNSAMQPRSPEINDTQADIIRQLFRHDGLRFAEINQRRTPSDQFSYHLRQLIKHSFIEKHADNTYRLTTLGRSQAIMIDPTSNRFIPQGFLAVRIVLDMYEAGERFVLLQERSAVPFKGLLATPGDKIHFGEDVHTAAKRAMALQTGLDCNVALRGVRHLKDNYRGEIVQDKYFFVFRASNPRGELRVQGRTGHNRWISYASLDDPSQSIHGGKALIDMALQDSTRRDSGISSKNVSFFEQTFDIGAY